MRFLLAALPSVLWALTSTCKANPLVNHEFGRKDAQAADIDTLNETLWRRVRIPGGTGNDAPPPVEQLFRFGPDNLVGGCSGQKDKLQSWLDEVRLVHNAVEQLYAMVTDKNVAMIWHAIFGIIMWQNPDTKVVEVDDISKDRWKAIGEHIARMSQFLDGGGLREPVVAGEVPRIFCSPDAGQYMDWNRALLDADGNEVVLRTLPNGDKIFVTLGQAYPGLVGKNAFWMSSFNGYWFTKKKGDEDQSLCPANGRLGATAQPLGPPLRGMNVRFASTERGIIICPRAWQRQIGEPHGQPSLQQAVVGDHYPKGDGSDAEKLDRLVPQSMTLYHELVHLTEFQGQTAEPDKYHLSQCLNMAFNPDPSVMAVVAHNPETYVYLGIAAYVYLNPPEGKDRVMFLGGVSATTTRFWAAMERKHQGS
ncbi:hypothetical protein V8C44DRAFT_369759 [Trichoderma aethiopicum]